MPESAKRAALDSFQQGRYDAIFSGKTLVSPCPYGSEPQATHWREGVLDAVSDIEAQRQLDAETAKVMCEQR